MEPPLKQNPTYAIAPESPDMNPIEHIWAFMVKEWNDRNERTKEALRAHVLEMWQVARRSNICERERERIGALLEANGGHTKY